MPTVEELLKMTEGVTEEQDALQKLAATQVTGTPFREKGQNWYQGMIGGGTPAQTQAMLAMLSNPRKQGQTGMQALGEGFNKGMALRDNIMEKEQGRKVNAAKLGVQGAQDTLKNQAEIYKLEQGELAGKSAAEQARYDRMTAEEQTAYDRSRDAMKDEQWRSEHGLDVAKLEQETAAITAQEGEEAARAYEEAVLIQDDLLSIEDSLGFKTSGATGAAASVVPGTDAYVHNQRIESLKSKLGLGKLAELRRAAASGASGMGNLTEKELMVLQDSLGKLEIGLPQDEQRRVMENISKYYMKAINAYNNISGGRATGNTGGGYDSSTGQMGAPRREGAPQAVPTVGSNVGGYTYMGGDPNSQSSWSKN